MKNNESERISVGFDGFGSFDSGSGFGDYLYTAQSERFQERVVSTISHWDLVRSWHFFVGSNESTAGLQHYFSQWVGNGFYAG